MPSRPLHARELASDRADSEDRAEVFANGDALVVVVADGAGGIGGGAAAADALLAAVRSAALDPSTSVLDAALWSRIFRETDAELAAAMSGETTAVVVVIHAAGLLGVSVGDSEAWVVTDRGVDDLTAGQSRRRLGSGRAAPVAFDRTSVDGVLVVATDGLFQYAPRDTIAGAVRGPLPEEACRHLVASVKLRSGGLQDDVGVVVVARAAAASSSRA